MQYWYKVLHRKGVGERFQNRFLEVTFRLYKNPLLKMTHWSADEENMERLSFILSDQFNSHICPWGDANLNNGSVALKHL